MDYTVDSFVYKMIKAMTCISVLMMVAGIGIFRSYLAIGFALGVGLSLVLNIVKVLWLKYAVNRAVNMQSSAAGIFISANYIIRFLLTGLVLVAAHFLPVVDMFGAVIGLLAMPFANYVVHFLNRKNTPDTGDTGNDLTNVCISTNNMNEDKEPLP